MAIFKRIYNSPGFWYFLMALMCGFAVMDAYLHRLGSLLLDCVFAYLDYTIANYKTEVKNDSRNND